ncbi:MAG: glycosyltransferase family 2 protein [Leptolyngbyaceae cyanobacterium RU_5_1]|nr:glycosyltransferase family 2 protein [Leptolyngbyaceae cyanobacterium RU_5_1]
MNTLFPPISPVSEGIHRPLWSVMIPTYNGTKYLEQTLKSVLEQDPGPDQMQIEVVDDCSTQDDPEQLVREIGNGRISFYRQPQNVGLLPNWNACIERSRGHWVHLLHQDDAVLPGFYERLNQGIERESGTGALLCRHLFMDEEGDWQAMSELERRTPGILTDWLEKLPRFSESSSRRSW